MRSSMHGVNTATSPCFIRLCYHTRSDCHTTELFNLYCIRNCTSAAVFSHALHLHHQMLVSQSGAMQFKVVHTEALLAESAL